MKFDDVLTELGDFGKYQKILYFFACFPILFIAMQVLNPVFVLAIPHHRCAVPGLPNDTYQIQSDLHRKLVQLSVPKKDGEYSKCDVFKTSGNVSALAISTENNTNQVPLNASKIRCTSWVYDDSVFHDTIVTEVDLVCSRTILRAHSITAFDVGALLGHFLYGPLSDRFGRKPTYILEICIVAFASIFMVWLPHIYVYITSRFVLGFGSGAFFNVVFLYILEFIGPSHRATWGLLVNNAWAIGLFIHAGIAFGLRQWRHLQLATALPILAFLLYWWFLPESPRWLFTKKQPDKGKQLIKRISQVNGVKFDINKLDHLETTVSESTGSMKDLVQSRALTIRCFLAAFNWFAVNMTSYGLSLNIGNLSGDIYLNFFYSALMEFAGYSVCIPAVAKVGRKKFHSVCMVFGGLPLLLTPLPLYFGNPSNQWTINLLAMTGKFLESAAYATLILFTNELFPTVVRNTVLSVCLVFSQTGGIIAPYVTELANLLEGKIAKVLPMVVFGILSFAAGLMALCLPETSDTALPDTIKDAKTLDKFNRQDRDNPKLNSLKKPDTLVFTTRL